MASCINKNLPEYKKLLGVYNNELVVSIIIRQYQKNLKSDDAYPSLAEASIISKELRKESQDNVKAVKSSIIANLKDLGLVVGPIRGSYFIRRTLPGQQTADASFIAKNLQAAKAYLSENGLSSAVSFVGDKNQVAINTKKLPAELSIKQGSTNLVHILSQLESVIPSVTIKIVTESEAKAILDNIEEDPSVKPDFKNVKSFYHNGTAYLIQGRVTNDVAIEEVLHPFVDALKKDNSQLFNKLFIESKINFPGLYQRISRIYPSGDVETELVTQALSRHMAKQYELQGNISRSYKEAFEELKQWIRNLFEKVMNIFRKGGEDVIEITPAELTSANNLSSIAKILGLSDLTIAFTPIKDNKVRYSIAENRRPEAEKLFKSATQAQMNTANTLIFEDSRNIELIDTQTEKHVYVDIDTGEEFQSVTKGIKGSMSAEDLESKATYLFFGNKFDFILESLAFNKEFDEIAGELEGLDLTVARQAYDIFQEQVNNLRSDGSILVPQVIFHHEKSSRAGSADIVVIHADGSISILDLKTSKFNLTGDYYDKLYTIDAEDSVFDGASLSTRQQHAIQIGAYAAMAEERGVTVREMGVLALQVAYDDSLTRVTSLVNDDRGNPNFALIRLSPSENKDYVDQLLTLGDYYGLTVEQKSNPVRDPEFLTEEEKQPETKQEKGPEFTAQEEENMYEFVSSVRGSLQTRLEGLRQLVSSSKSVGGRTKMLHKLSSLLLSIDSDLKSGDIKKAFFELMKYTKEDIENFMRYASDESNLDSYDFPTVLNFYNNSFKTYQGFKEAADLLRMDSKDLRNMHADIISMLNTAEDVIKQAYFNYVKNLVKTKTSIGKEFTDEQALDDAITSMLTVVKDIGLGSLNLDDIGSTASSVKRGGETVKVKNDRGAVEEVAIVQDRLLPLIKIIYFQQIEKRNNILAAFEELVKEEGNALVNAMRAAGLNPKDSKDIYGFMLDEDADGNFNGRYVRNIGPQFFKRLYEIKKEASNDEGELLRFHNVVNASQSPELAKENIEIYRKRSAWDNFKRPEIIQKGVVKDGDYYKYTDEFKTERNKYEYFDGYSWIKRTNVSVQDYNNYKAKYYELGVPYMKKVFKNGAFTGETIQEKGDFVKREHVEIRELSADGTNMRNVKYDVIMSDNSALGLARQRFYKTYVDQMENNLLKKLPSDIYFKMLGKVGRMESNLMNSIMKRPGEIGSVMTKTMARAFDINREVYAKTAVENEAGEIISTPPIFFISDLQNKRRIESLENSLKTLDEDFTSKKISFKDYREKKDAFSGMLKAEKEKITPDKIEIDLVKNIIGFSQMAENFHQLQVVEDTINAVGQVIQNRKYVPENATMSSIMKGSDKVGWAEVGKSNTEKRFKKWLEMVFYDESGHEKSVMEKATQKILNATSVTYVGFNIFGNINNAIMGTINNAIETAGAQFYGRKEMLRANKEFGGAVTGFMRGLGSKEGGYYTTKKPQTKYEAMVNYFRVVRRFQSGEGRPEASWIDFAYLLQEGGEYMVQSKTGVAVLMSTMVNNAAGEQMSIYDAFDFNEQTGSLTLKQGYSFTEEEKANLTLKIYDLNRYIHGNYSYTERTAIQQYWWGKLVMQFHKWVVPAFQARFRSGYNNETLGFIEGRYRTLWNFAAHVAKERGSIVQRVNEAKGALTEAEVSNMYKVAAELGFVLASMALYQIFDKMLEGVDDDDLLTKRLLNAMKYQASRQQAEILTFVKPTEYVRLLTNPVASSRALREYGELMEATAKLGAYGVGIVPEKDVIYQRGSRKGQYKVFKQLGDAAPILYTWNRWLAYDNVDEFGIFK